MPLLILHSDCGEVVCLVQLRTYTSVASCSAMHVSSPEHLLLVGGRCPSLSIVYDRPGFDIVVLGCVEVVAVVILKLSHI